MIGHEVFTIAKQPQRCFLNFCAGFQALALFANFVPLAVRILYFFIHLFELLLTFRNFLGRAETRF